VSVEEDVRHGSVDQVCPLVEFIIAKFIRNVEYNNNAASEADREADYVYQRIHPVVSQVSQRDTNVISNHVILLSQIGDRSLDSAESNGLCENRETGGWKSKRPADHFPVSSLLYPVSVYFSIHPSFSLIILFHTPHSFRSESPGLLLSLAHSASSAVP